jgi:EAL domain-containing protein (putative c-di-GMP-specific phosphodiesterase class I)
VARYGGEEFAVLLPDTGLSDAAACIQALADVTPSGQTFSAGVALWTPGTDPASVVSAADVALYAAKSGGRNRIETVAGESRLELPAVLQDFTIALQPIVDATTGRVLAHEALSRFSHARDVAGVYAQAHREGHGDLLEATAIRRAIEVPGRPEGTELFVNVSAAALASERFWQLLPADLGGLVVELLESRDSLDWESLRARMDQLLQRNARLAVDDLGAGSGDLARFLVIRPHVVKIDRALVDGCAHDGTRERLLEVVVDLAHASGSVVCAEGVEQQADLETLRALGVDLIQGYLIGRPSAAWTTSALLPV